MTENKESLLDSPEPVDDPSISPAVPSSPKSFDMGVGGQVSIPLRTNSFCTSHAWNASNPPLSQKTLFVSGVTVSVDDIDDEDADACRVLDETDEDGDTGEDSEDEEVVSDDGDKNARSRTFNSVQPGLTLSFSFIVSSNTTKSSGVFVSAIVSRYFSLPSGVVMKLSRAKLLTLPRR